MNSIHPAISTMPVNSEQPLSQAIISGHGWLSTGIAILSFVQLQRSGKYRVFKKTHDFSCITRIAVTCETFNRFTNRFFSWKLKSICKFLIQNHFCPILEDWDIWKTKGGSEVDKLIFILTRNSTCGSRLVSANHKRPQTGPCLILSTPYWPLLEP